MSITDAIRSPKAARDAVLADPSESTWLKVTLFHAEQRDPIDALADASYLVYLLRRRVEALQGK